jgi:hypothetical protein
MALEPQREILAKRAINTKCLAFINGVLLANRVLIFRFQLLAVYVLLVHNCGELSAVFALSIQGCQYK